MELHKNSFLIQSFFLHNLNINFRDNKWVGDPLEK